MRQPQCSKEEEGRALHGAKCVVARAVTRAQRAATAWDVARCEGKPAAQRRETEVKGDEVREEAGDRVEGASPADMIRLDDAGLRHVHAPADGSDGEGGSVAPVRCVVLTECPGGRALLTRLPNGTELTEWHPIRADASIAQTAGTEA